MSKSVWLTRPTQRKADALQETYHWMRAKDYSGRISRAFAGYFLEREVQGLSSVWDANGNLVQRSRATMLTGAVKSNWRFMRNPNYTKAFFRHNVYWLRGVELEDAELFGPVFPPLICQLATALYDGEDCSDPMYDALQELGYVAQAEYYAP